MFEKKDEDNYSEDSELFDLIQQGNKEAFTAIYQKYHKIMYVIAYRYLKDSARAQDAVQYVFTKLWEYHSNLQVSFSLKNYLFSMTRNHILNQIRNENNAVSHQYQIFQDAVEYEDNLIEVIEQKELVHLLYKAIENLPDQKKTVCLLRLDEKLSNKEIAEKMQISINTVKTHYAQSLKLLRILLEKLIILLFFISLSSLCNIYVSL